MVWQDIVLTIATIIIGYSLVPQVYKGFKKKKGYVTKQTSFLMGFSLLTVGYIFLTLDLLLSTIITWITAILWTLLFIQSIIYKK